MVIKTDLHVHTNVSDGRFSPQEIIKKAVKCGLSVIAICDHDNTNGIASALIAAKAYPQLKIIPGVEISTYAPGNEVHILGYFMDFYNPNLVNTLADSRNSRLERAKGMIARLKKLNIDISWQQVQRTAGESTIGRPHIAQVMLDNGYIKSLKEAFDKYIGLGGPAYIERYKITPLGAVTLIKEADGLPVLAHPLTIEQPEEIISELKTVGLVGIEVYYNGYTENERNTLLQLANKYNLITTGGSDYHGLDENAETNLGGADVPPEVVEQLMGLIKQQS